MKRTNIYKNVREGEWLHCNNCEENMLLPNNADRCPECGNVGCLTHVKHDATDYDLSDIDNPYETGHDISPMQYLSRESYEDIYDEKEAKYMERTSFCHVERYIRAIAIEELQAALKAWGGTYNFCPANDEGDMDECGTYDNCPLIVAHLPSGETTEVYIAQAVLKGGGIDFTAYTRENYYEVDLTDYCIPYYEVAAITERILQTTDVKSVAQKETFKVVIENGHGDVYSTSFVWNSQAVSNLMYIAGYLAGANEELLLNNYDKVQQIAIEFTKWENSRGWNWGDENRPIYKDVIESFIKDKLNS